MRTNSNYGGLMGRIAHEAEVDAAQVEETPVEALGDAVESVEAELLEVNAGVEEIADMVEDIDEAAEVVEDLEVAAEALREANANGGLNRDGAKFLNLHLEGLYNKVGMNGSSKTIACESFGQTLSRVDAGTLSLENIKENAGKLWAAIVEMIQKGIQYIKDLFNKFFDAATKLKARAEALAKRAGETKGEATTKTFTNDKVANMLHRAGKVEGLPEAAKQLAETSKNVSTSLVDASIRSAESLLKSLTAGDFSGLKGAATAFAVAGEATDAATVGIKAPGEGLKITRDKELLGNRALVMILPAAEDAKPEVYAKVGVKLGQFNATAKAPEKAEMAVLSPSDAASVANSVKVIAENVLAFKSKMSAIDSLKGKIVAEAKKQAGVTSEVPKDGTGPSTEGKISSADARALAKGAASMVDQPAAAFMPYQLNTGVALLNAVELSLKAYGAKAAAPAAAAPAAAAA